MSDFTVTVDTTDYDRHMQEFERRKTLLLDAHARQSLTRLGEHMKSHMDEDGPEPGEFSSSDRVGQQSGRLRDAVTFGTPFNSSRVIFTAAGVQAVWIPNTAKVPYLSIQNDGGFVKHKGKMPFYLFRLAKETGNIKYRWMGAAALKNGGITIKARAFVEPGTRDFERLSLPRLNAELGDDIGRTWNAI